MRMRMIRSYSVFSFFFVLSRWSSPDTRAPYVSRCNFKGLMGRITLRLGLRATGPNYLSVSEITVFKTSSLATALTLGGFGLWEVWTESRQRPKHHFGLDASPGQSGARRTWELCYPAGTERLFVCETVVRYNRIH
jgi:hypothetical protein